MRLEIFCTAILSSAFLAVLGGWWDGAGPLALQMAGLAAVAAVFSAIVLSIAVNFFAATASPSGETHEGSGAAGWAADVLGGLIAPAAVLDQVANIVAANRTFLSGFASYASNGRIVGLPASDLVDPADRPTLASALAAIADRSFQPDAPVILRMLRADQAAGLNRMSLTSLYGADGTGFGLLQALRFPQNARSESDAGDCDSRLLIDCIEEIVFKIDAEGRLIFLNASWETLLDHALPASLGKPLLDFVHPEAKPVAETQLMALASGERDSCHVEVRMTAKAGTSYWMELRARPLSSVRGARSIVVGTLADISRMKRTEASLRANRRSLSMLLSNVPGMVYRCKNDRNWSFDFASDGCIDVTGYEPYEIVGNSELSYIEIVHPDDRAAAWEFVRRQVALRRKFQLVYRIVSRSGQVRWVWEQGKGVFSSTGEILALEGFITDISDDGGDEIVRGFKKLLSDC